MAKTAKAKKKNQIQFEYKISPNYNAYTASGIIGGLTSSGDILMNLFHERNAIPQTVTYSITENGTLGDEVDRNQKDAVIRNVFMGITLTPHTAKSIADWLYKRIGEHEKTLMEAHKKRDK